MNVPASPVADVAADTAINQRRGSLSASHRGSLPGGELHTPASLRLRPLSSRKTASPERSATLPTAFESYQSPEANGPDPLETDADALLQAYLNAPAPVEDEALVRLVARLEPTVRGVVRRRLLAYVKPDSTGAEDGEDLCCAARLRLLETLHNLKHGSFKGTNIDDETATLTAAEGGLRHVRAWVETVTRNLLHEHLRRKYPRRTSLQNQVLYVLRHTRNTTSSPNQPTARFATWKQDRERVCGFARWEGRGIAHNERFEELCRAPHRVAGQWSSGGEAPKSGGQGEAARLPQLLEDLWNWVGGPTEFDATVSVLAQLLGVQDAPEVRLDAPVIQADSGEESEWELPSYEPSPEEQTVRRDDLRAMWQEIERLPSGQCAALLLGSDDGRGQSVVSWLLSLGIASVGQMARAVSLPPARFAALAQNLPLDDSAIAAIVECPLSRVAVWRFRARRRLAALNTDC